MELHSSGQIPNTMVLYYTPSKYRVGKFRPCESEIKIEWTPILDRPPGPGLNGVEDCFYYFIVFMYFILCANFSEVYRNKLSAESGTKYDLDL